MGQNDRGQKMGKVRRKERNLIFWNIAGIRNKDKKFWGYIKRFDFVSLSETWVEKKKWEKLKKRLSETHE